MASAALVCMAAAAVASPNGTAASQLVPVIVTMKARPDLSSVHGPHASRLSQTLNTLESLAARTQRGVRALLEQRRREGKANQVAVLWIINGLAVEATQEVADEIRARADVLSVAPDEATIVPAGAAAAAAAPPEPGVALVQAPALWGLGHRGQGVVVGVMDTGVDSAHPDLAPRWRGGSNSWYDPNGEHATPFDRTGHGTGTTGLILGGDAGGSSIGVAPDAKWIAVKIFNDLGVAYTSRVHLGFQWLLNPDGNVATDDAADVVNNSWSYASPICNLSYQGDLQALRAAGILPIFSAGNTGPLPSTSVSPSNNPEAFAVGSTTVSDTIATESARGPSACGETSRTYPEAVAPGVNVRTADLAGGYRTISGTSAAAPSAAGILALLLSAYPTLSVAGQQAALETGVDLGTPGPDNTFGFGRVAALAAFNSIIPPAPVPDFTIAAAPSSVSVDPGGSASLTVTVGSVNGFSGAVTLSVAGLPAGASASAVPPTIPGGSGTSTLTLTTSTSTPPGAYTVTITGTSGTTTHDTWATLTVRAPSAGFSLTAAPSTVSTSAGGAAGYTITVTPLSGFSANVGLTLSGAPAGSTTSFVPQTIAGGSGTSQLTVQTSSTTPVGGYGLTITGSGGGVTRTAGVTLNVTAGQTVFPSTVTIESGSAGGGTVSALAADDASYFSVNSTPFGIRLASWYGVLNGVPNSASSLKVTYKGKNSIACTQTVSIFKWTTGAWVVLDSRSVGATDVSIADLAPPGALADYVSGTTGNGSARIRVRCTGPITNFTSSGNLMKVVFAP